MLKLSLKNRIMLGIYFTYLTRKLRNPFIVESILLAVLLMAIFYLVSVPSVLVNMSGSGSFSKYLLLAFTNTGFIIQSTIIMAFITAIFFVRNLTLHAILKERLA